MRERQKGLEALLKQAPVAADLSANDFGVGRELFMPFRGQVNRADEGATIFRVQ